MRINLLALSLLGLILAQCKKRESDPVAPNPLTLLPPETQTGAGTFGCLVNGKAYTAPYATSARGDWMSTTRLGISSSVTESDATKGISVLLALNGKLDTNQQFTIISSASPYPLFTPGLNQFWAASAGGTCTYDGSYIKKGTVELVKFDGVARIASGRFSFTIYESGGCDTLKVTNGRFDVKF
jgi:hypothetical protein